ncbi:hypothetical protein B0H10DRAFT_1791917, partial [Mycena sp. CBHHK59/15]
HRSPLHSFSDSEKFRPERWLEVIPAFEKHETAAYLLFAFGPYNCSGQRLAKHQVMMSMSLLFVRLSICGGGRGQIVG